MTGAEGLALTSDNCLYALQYILAAACCFARIEAVLKTLPDL